jgi:hypothetical protein
MACTTAAHESTSMEMLEAETHAADKRTSNCVSSQQHPALLEPADHPEGGLKAWSVVFGAWCAMVPSMGLLYSLGILHAWTSAHQLKSYSESSIGWIFGAYGFFLYFAGAQAGTWTFRTWPWSFY